MSSGISARLKLYKKPELTKSASQVLLNKLQQEGSMRTIENAMQRVEYVYCLLLSKNIDATAPYKDDIHELLQTLKVYGAYLDLLYPEQLNRSFVVFRNCSQDEERLDYLSRLYLLELIELRANSWKTNDITGQYYKKKASQYAQVETLDTASSLTDSMISSASSMAPILGPGEVIKPSGKFTKPTRIPGKNYCKDEVVIRNADSGKVMGIKGRRVHMIEELSETIISFQRVSPGAKERLVQITGASEDSINHAKQLIEDTIRRNASPVREQSILGAPLTGSSSSINSSASDDSALPHSARASRTLLHSLSSNDATVGEYKYTVLVGNSVIKITGNNLDIVRTSKLVLDEYFSGEPIQDIGQFYSFDSLPQPISESPLSPPESPNSLPNGKLDEPLPVVRLRKPRTSIEDIMKGNIPAAPVQSVPRIPYIKHIYSIELLARLAMSPLCLVQPINWDDISTVYPNLVRKETEYFDAKQYLSNRSNYGYSTIVNAGNGAEDS